MKENYPAGICHCGCGGATSIHKFNDKFKGRIKGGYCKYITGHNNRSDPVDRFFNSFVVASNGCWEWKGIDTNRYALIHVNDKNIGAHRLSYIVHNGPIPEGLHVLHKCDNKKCCNPEHLFLGTSAENMQDKVNKSRQAKGSDVYLAKLTEDSVVKIKERLSRGEFINVIAKEYNVSRQAISQINNGTTWKHV